MENKNRIRTYLRSLISKNIYNKLAGTLNKLETIRSQGFTIYNRLFDTTEQGYELKSINFRNVQHPIYYRPNTIDVPTLVQSLIRKEYGKGLKSNSPEYIIDAGCYIGDVTIFYLNKFPNSKIIALEPNESNYEVAKLNLEPYKERTIVINKGLWSSKASLSFKGDFTTASLGIDNKASQKIECIDMNSLLIENKFEHLDLLKMDIEGAELEVILKNSDTWLPKTKMIAVEFHSDEIKQLCLNKLYEYDFEGFEYRSIFHLINRSIS